MLDGVDLTSRRATFIGLVGPVGLGQDARCCGRSSARSSPRAGRVDRRAGLRVGYVPQVETVDWNFPVTVSRVRADGPRRGPPAALGEPRRARRGGRGARRGSASATSAERHIRELSGGQQQRVFMARALLQRPRAAAARRADLGRRRAARHEVLHLLDDLQRDGVAIVLTTHDLNGIAAHLPRLVCLNRQVIGGRPAARGADRATCSSSTYGAAWRCSSTAGMPVVVDAYGRDHAAPHPHESRVARWTELLRPLPLRVLPQRPDGGDDRGRAVRPDRRVRRAEGHELHRPRPLARDLRRLRGQRPARRQLPPGRRRLGRRLGADDRRRHPAARDRRRRRHRRHHHRLVRPRPRAVRALRAPGGELRRGPVRQHPRRQPPRT